MQLLLVRIDQTDRGIFGKLTCSNNPFNCVTLENHLLDIKPGTYKITLDNSPHLGYITPHLQVPDRDKTAGGDAGIRIHILNNESQSQGCIGVGTCRDGFDIDNSRIAFNNLMKVLVGNDDISITIK